MYKVLSEYYQEGNRKSHYLSVNVFSAQSIYCGHSLNRGEGKTLVPGEKPLGARTRTNNKLNPDMTSSPGIEPGPHW